MAGHSKWANIKNRKGAQDAKKGKIFSQMSKNIKIAVKEGKSGDVNTNAALRLAIDKARAANMPKENIQRAIDRGLGKSATGAAIQEVIYEGYGPQGVGLVIVALTDNTQRTSSSIKNLVSKAGGSLGGPGSVMYMFERNQDGDYVCTMPMAVDDEAVVKKIEDLMDKLREDEDVEDVYSALQYPDQ